MSFKTWEDAFADYRRKQAENAELLKKLAGRDRESLKRRADAAKQRYKQEWMAAGGTASSFELEWPRLWSEIAARAEG